MTPKERYHALLAGESVDFFPRVPIVMQFAAEYIGSNYGSFASDYRTLVQANIACAQDFGFDQLSTISDPYRETQGFGAEIRYQKNGVPECIRAPLAGIDEIEELQGISLPDPEQVPRMRDRIDAIRLYKELTGDHYSIMGWVEGPAALAGVLRGLTDFLMDLIDEPEYSSQLLNICTDTAIRFARIQIENGADTIGIGDAICSQISPAIYNELIWPCQKRLVDSVKAAGAKVRLHICGQTEHLWPKLHDLPIDILDCDHMVDLVKARAVFPSSVILGGNLDPVTDLFNGNPFAISAKVKKCICEAGPNFIVNAGCEIPSGTPKDNIKALCQPIPRES